jgi:hypothetical protein
MSLGNTPESVLAIRVEEHGLATTVLVVVGEPKSLLDLIARFVREELEQGRFNSLIAAHEALLDPEVGNGAFMKAAFRALTVPTTEADAAMPVPETLVIPDEVVNVVRSASPKVANEIQIRSPQDAIAVINLFAALIQMLTALVTLYLAQHPANPVSPQQIVQIFDQSVHTVNQTTVINAPPPPRAG